MKILVISDTHGDIGTARKIWASLDDLDLILHLGDHYTDAEKLASSIRTKVIAVPGNMDGECDLPLNKVIDTEYGPVLITHGHAERVRRSLDALIYRAQENNCKAVFFGHTHVAMDEIIDGIHVVNPGSLSRPRDGERGSYALIDVTSASFKCRIQRVGDDPPKKNNKKSGSVIGKLRSLLNYSDRL